MVHNQNWLNLHIDDRQFGPEFHGSDLSKKLFKCLKFILKKICWKLATYITRNGVCKVSIFKKMKGPDSVNPWDGDFCAENAANALAMQVSHWNRLRSAYKLLASDGVSTVSSAQFCERRISLSLSVCRSPF